MKVKKYFFVMSVLLLLFAPFMLLAQQAKNNIGPNTYRLDRIIGAAIVTEGTAGSEALNDGTDEQSGEMPKPTLTPTPWGDGNGIQDGNELNNTNGMLDYEIGKVSDMVVDAQGRITQIVAVLSENRGWHWWAGTGSYLIPASEFDVRESGNELLMEIGLVQAASIPHANSEDAVQQLVPHDAVLLTHFKNFSVFGPNGEKVGNIEDVVVNVLQQEVRYAALTVGGYLGVGAKLYAIPFSEIQFNAGAQRITLGITPEELDNLAPFNPDNWPENAAP